MIDGELTEDEIEVLRRDGQASLTYLAFLDTPAVFKARVNQSFAGNDKISQVAFDNVTLGDYTDVLPGMTCWVGSSDGDYDLGQMRVRKDPTSNTLYIGETSDIDWADELYLTVVDDFGIWVRPPYTDASNVVFMDRDVAYADQHEDMLPFAIIGSDRVGRLAGESIDFEFDGSASWCPGSTIVGHAFDAPGASATSGMDTATPIISYDAIGTYRVAYTVLADNGKSCTTYRKVFVWDQAHAPLVWDPSEMVASDFVLERLPNSSIDRGGCEFTVRMLNQAGIDLVRDRQKVILFTRDFYGGEEISIGPLAGSENIWAEGWIDGESLDPGPRGSSVTFEVKGPHFWLGAANGPSLNIINTAAAAATWSEIQGLTVQKALASYLTWRTTVPLCMDCFLTDDTRLAPGFDAALGSIWQQLNLIASRILARALCDRFGRVGIEIELKSLPEAERDSIPVVMQIEKRDRRKVSLQRRPSPATSLMQISCQVLTAADAQPFTVYSMSGHVHRRFGRGEPPRDGFLAASQAQSNEMCGLIMGQANNPFPDIDIDLGANNRAIDIFPRQYISAPVEAGDSPREIAFNGRIIPREVSFERATRGGFLAVVHGEAEAFEALAIDGDIPNSPAMPSVPPIPALPKFPSFDIAPSWPLPVDPVVVQPAIYLLFAGYGLFYTETLDDEEPQWLAKNNGAPENLGTLIFFEIDKRAGILYVGANNGLWYGALGDPNLTQFIDQDWLDEEFPLGGILPQSENNRISGIGINQAFANNLIVSASSGYLGTRTAYAYTGSYAGLARKTGIPWEGVDGGSGNLTFGGGVWLATHVGFINRNYWARYPQSAASVLESHYDDSPNLGYWHIRAGSTAVVYVPIGSGEIYYSDDNLATYTARDFVAGIIPACSLDGSLVMCMRSGGGMERSTDFGATWGTMPGFPAGVTPTAVACIDDDRWIVACHDIIPYPPVILYTDDFGETWVDKTGDLATYVPESGSGIRKVIPV